MTIPVTERTTWRDLAITRVVGSALSWFLFVMNLYLLFLVSTAVLSIGGSCASGGPFEIAVQCPDNVGFAPLSIFGGLFAVVVALFLARGYGVPLVVWAWPLLFGSLGGLFLAAFFFTGDITGLVIGGMFELMAIAPLIVEIRGSLQRVLIGTVDARGIRFQEGPRARRSFMSTGAPNPEGAVKPTILHWLASLVIAGGSGYAGYVVANLWFFSGAVAS